MAVANLVPFAALLIVAYAAASDLASTGSMSDSYRYAYVALSLITVLTAPLVLGAVVVHEGVLEGCEALVERPSRTGRILPARPAADSALRQTLLVRSLPDTPWAGPKSGLV